MVATIATVVRILAGLPWGPQGVAIRHYELVDSNAADVLDRRLGIIRAHKRFLPDDVTVSVRLDNLLAGLAWFRSQMLITDPGLGLMFALGVAAPIYLCLVCVFPSGRQAVLDLRDNLGLLRRTVGRASPE